MELNRWTKLFLLCTICGVLEVHSQIWKKWKNCYDSSGNPLPCVPDAINVALERKVDASNTCGSPKAGYCELGPQKKCLVCDSNSTNNRHPAKFLVDKQSNPFTSTTWWQSQNWFETNQLGLSDVRNPLKVNITLSFNKTYVISGRIAVRFYQERPQAMIIDKSADHGKTWESLQYFAKNCRTRYNMPQHTSGIVPGDPFQLTCTESYSTEIPKKWGEVKYIERYNLASFLTPQTQSYLLATNVRIRLEYPATDGMQWTGNREALNQYYYAISDISVVGRCSCHGHAKYCSGLTMAQWCNCEHNTMGTDCEECKPLYNNRPWKAANITHAHECQECECNKHGTSCTYNTTLGYGECQGCKHNTDGKHCERCKYKFYRNLIKPMTDPGACLACDCYPPGTVDGGNATCQQAATPSKQIGQCKCKRNVYGRRCNECSPAHWGFTLPPQGECKPCSCNNRGTVNNSPNCSQSTGQCPCKPGVTGQHCDQCKDGHHSFPNCHKCQCDLGGAIPFCNKNTGACKCRHGVDGPLCKKTVQGRFFPALDFLRFEAEKMEGNFTFVSPLQNNGSTFTGLGLARLGAEQYVKFRDIIVPMTYSYHVVIRYSGGCSESKLAVMITQESYSHTAEVLLQFYVNSFGEAYIFGNQSLDSGALNVTITNKNDVPISSNCLPLLIDSVVLIPDANHTRVFSESNSTVQTALQKCTKSRSSLSLIKQESSQCEALVFSASTEIYNGTKACDCNSDGSNNPSHCETYGGKCTCKPGIGGRTCTHCLSGYYGSTTSGCKSCSCSSHGALRHLCNARNGQCQCKPEVEGLRCNQCKMGTFNLYSVSPKGCQHCFGYGHAVGCTSADGFIAANISTDFFPNDGARNSTIDGWRTVDASDNTVKFVSSLNNGMVVTSVASPSMFYISAPEKFLGNQIRSYGQKLTLKVDIRCPGNTDIVATTGDVALQNDNTTIELKLGPSLSPNTTEYHVILDETSLANKSSATVFEFQSVLANLTSLKIRGVFCPYPVGSAVFKSVAMDTAKEDEHAAKDDMVSFVENATCQANYTGLSCEKCASGYTREVVGSSPFGKCVLCSCNNRSRECDPDTGSCTNCKVGTYGALCELCRNNVQGPDCLRCLPGHWGLSKSGCSSCQCDPLGTSFVNSTCDWNTGQCMCNATMHVGGRRCDRCKENAWNRTASPLSCEACPHCYGDIEIEVIALRKQISSLYIIVEALTDHPLMNQQKPFYQRFSDTMREAKAIMGQLNSTKEKERKADTKCHSLTLALDHVETKLNTTAASRVGAVDSLSSSVGTNHRETKEAIAQVEQLLQISYFILNVTIQEGINNLGHKLEHLMDRQSELRNLTFDAAKEENKTLLANETINRLTEDAIVTAARAATKAVTIVRLFTTFEQVLGPLRANSTRVRVYGEETFAMMAARLLNATQVLNESNNLLQTARTPNPNKMKELNELLSRAASIVRLSSELTNHSSSLFMSSLPYIGQIDSAILRANELEVSVMGVERNGTTLITSVEKERDIAMDAIDRANEIHRAAKEMLYILQNFASVVKDEQTQSAQVQQHIPVLTESAHNIITNITHMEPTVKRAGSHAADAAKMLDKAKRHLMQEEKALSEAHRIGTKLKNETVAAYSWVNNHTVRNYISENISPVQELCRNFTESAVNSSTEARKLRNQARNLNNIAAQLSTIADGIVNDSSNLPNVTADHLPKLQVDLKAAEQTFKNLNLDSSIATLRSGLTVQVEKTQTYKDKISEYKGKIVEVRKLLGSLNSLLKC